MKRFSALLLALLLMLSLLSAAAETPLLPDPVSLAPGLTQREEAVDYGAFWMHFYEGNEAAVSAAVDAYTAYLVDELGMEEVLPVTGDSLPESGDYAAAYRMPGDELSGSTFAMRGDFYQVDACHVMLMITLNGDYSLLNICHSPTLPCPDEWVPTEQSEEQSEDTSNGPLLPDPLDFSYSLYPTDATTDYDYCISHTYEGSDVSVQEAVEKYTAYLEEELGMKQVLYYVADPFAENDWYYAAWLAPEGYGESTFAMGGTGDFQVKACHVFLRYQMEPGYDRNELNITHSSAFPCPLETIVPVEETAEIQWYQMGTSGKSFYYGQYDETTGPAGFIVYESKEDSTFYGFNEGGYYDDLWDGTVITINRISGRVDSINLITAETGNVQYSVRYFNDGTITYATYENNKPKMRYDREGDRYTSYPYNPLAGRWYKDATEVNKEEIQPEWGMGYASFALECEEQQTEGGLHVGTYLLTGVTDEGETEEILHLEATPDGSVEYTLRGESWRYDHAASTYTQLNAPAQ